ncbi:hypothetical protein OHB12_30195 [Nocardia sp. NBC_01730]|uniref:hypothetical protein n=1 Tax=Nocardia sp. NBC_01730 TaxID=2975998 RepID=UPI002E109027|nr:hypothetical protein OHB12_30195 [Nocardia sp. NBC_01730]
MTTVSQSSTRLLLAISMRLLVATMAALATVAFTYLLLHPNSSTGAPESPRAPVSTMSPHP